MPFHTNDKTKRSHRDQKSSSLSSARPPSSSEHVAQQDYKARISSYSSTMGVDSKKGRVSSFSSKNLEIDNDNDDGLRASKSSEESTGDSETEELVQLLALQSYHLPGNSWMQDWCQFMANNHPIFGVCCHNKVHPIKSCTRIVALAGTITFGLAITNVFYVFYLWNPEYNRVLASIATDNGTEYVLTTGMLLLWTVGGGAHCAFNLAMWHIAACACCKNGGFCESCACCPSLGKYMIRFFVLCTAAFCVLIIVLRVAINDEAEDEPSNADDGNANQGLNIENLSEFSFVFNYFIEMTLAFFVYYPICVTTLLSGILSCGYAIPVVGGRPYEIAREERRNSRRQGDRDRTKGSIIIEI